MRAIFSFLYTLIDRLTIYSNFGLCICSFCSPSKTEKFFHISMCLPHWSLPHFFLPNDNTQMKITFARTARATRHIKCGKWPDELRWNLPSESENIIKNGVTHLQISQIISPALSMRCLGQSLNLFNMFISPFSTFRWILRSRSLSLLLLS